MQAQKDELSLRESYIEVTFNQALIFHGLPHFPRLLSAC